VFREKIAGTTADRPQLVELMKRLVLGDVVITPAVDRLSRDTTDLITIARDMQRAGAGVRSRAEPYLDTTSDFAEIVFAILGVAAKLERRRVLERTARGRADAKARGVKFGGWAGLANLFYWIDRQNGFGGFWATQILPFGDPASFAGYIDFEVGFGPGVVLQRLARLGWRTSGMSRALRPGDRRCRAGPRAIAPCRRCRSRGRRKASASALPVRNLAPNAERAARSPD
jgi:Resolvase, N terminal domain